MFIFVAFQVEERTDDFSQDKVDKLVQKYIDVYKLRL